MTEVVVRLPAPRRPAPSWTFADRARKARREIGLTQDEFAAQLGINPKRYAAWESGLNQPDNIVETAEALERLTGYPRMWFIGWDSPPDDPGGDAVHRQGLEPRTRWLRAVAVTDLAPGTSSMPLPDGDETLWPDVATMPQMPQIPRMYGKSIDSPSCPKSAETPIRTLPDRVVA